MPKRLALRLLNLLWYTTALALVLTATVVAVGREMMPQIKLDTPALSRALGERLGAEVQV